MSGLEFIGPALLLALLYGVARAIRDRRYVWAAAGALTALVAGVALVVPIPSHAVKIDLQ